MSLYSEALSKVIYVAVFVMTKFLYLIRMSQVSFNSSLIINISVKLMKTIAWKQLEHGEKLFIHFQETTSKKFITENSITKNKFRNISEAIQTFF